MATERYRGAGPVKIGPDDKTCRRHESYLRACKVCRRDYHRAWTKANRGRRAEHWKNYREKRKRERKKKRAARAAKKGRAA
jgi:hypothetical protein